MKKIEFKKLRIRNFLSFGNDTTEFEIKPGLTFITGYNKDKDSKNGVGKSTLMVESLSFLLFGDTYRKINQKSIVNNKTKETCIVEGLLYINEDKYEITRSLKPNKLILKKNDADISRTIPETNKDILDILGISKEIFTNTIVMNNKDSNTFLTQKSESKIKFIEGILSLEIFSKMYEIVNEDVKDNNKKIISGKTRITEQETSLASDRRYQSQENAKWLEDTRWLQEQITELKYVQPIDNSSAIQKVQEKIDDLNQKIKDTSNSDVIAKLEEQQNELREKIVQLHNEFAPTEEKYKKINIKCIQLESSIKAETNTLKNLKGKQTECPTCKRPFDDHNNNDLEHAKEDINLKIAEYNSQIQKLKQGLAKIDADRTNVNSKVSDIELEIAQLKKKATEHTNNIQEMKNAVYAAATEKNKLLEAQTLFTKSQDKISHLEEQLENAKDWVNPFNDKVMNAENNLSLLQTEQGVIEARHIILEAKKFATSPSGIKTLVVKKIIATFNERLNYYLNRLGAPVKCNFDEFFEEQFTTLDDKEFFYGNLSGGEAKRIDFAVLFTFRDIRRLQSNIFVNISVFDELFDSALDESAMTTIVSLLKETVDKTEEAFYIISHRSENVAVEGCAVVNLEKSNGITRII